MAIAFEVMMIGPKSGDSWRSRGFFRAAREFSEMPCDHPGPIGHLNSILKCFINTPGAFEVKELTPTGTRSRVSSFEIVIRISRALSNNSNSGYDLGGGREKESAIGRVLLLENRDQI